MPHRPRARSRAVRSSPGHRSQRPRATRGRTLDRAGRPALGPRSAGDTPGLAGADREALAARACAPRSCATCATSLTAVRPAGAASPNQSSTCPERHIVTPRKHPRADVAPRDSNPRPLARRSAARVTPATPAPPRPTFTRSRSWRPPSGAAPPPSGSASSPRRAHAPTPSSTMPERLIVAHCTRCHSRPRSGRDPPPLRPQATIASMHRAPPNLQSFVATIAARSLIRRTTAGSRQLHENGGLTALRALLPAFRRPHQLRTLGQAMISARCASRSGGHAPRAGGAA